MEIPFRQDAVLNKADHPILGILIKFLRHVPDFPIDSNGTKPGTLQLADEVSKYRSLVLFTGWTGARWGEAVALTVGNLDLDSGRATISKSASTIGGRISIGETKTEHLRTIGIPRHVCVELRADVRGKLPGALVWTNARGGHLTTPSKRSWFYSAVARCKAADEDFPRVTPHDLRHTAASMLIASGAPVVLVARQLGHQSAKLTLDTYAHLFDDQLSDVVRLSWDSANQGSFCWSEGLSQSSIPLWGTSILLELALQQPSQNY